MEKRKITFQHSSSFTKPKLTAIDINIKKSKESPITKNCFSMIRK